MIPTSDAVGSAEEAAVRIPLRRRAANVGEVAATTPAFWIALAEVALLLVFWRLSPNHVFLRSDNLLSIGLNSSELILLAVGGTFILGAAQLDLSVAANLVLSSVVAGKVIVALAGTAKQVQNDIYPHQTRALVIGICAGIATGLAFGIVNGLAVTKLKVNSFIVTLGTLGIGTGIAQVATDGSNIAYLPTSIQTGFGSRNILGVPAPLLLVVVLTAVAWFVLRATRFGVRVLALGSSETAVRRSGINADRLVIKVFAISGLLAGVAGIIDIARFDTTSISGHTTDNLAAISAVVIGGTSLFGGVASMGGTFIASFLPVLLVSGLVMLNVGPFYQNIVIGLILIGAVFIDQQRRRRRG